MDIKFQIHQIDNANGEGKKRPYVQLFTSKPKNLEEIAKVIEEASTVTAADIKAVMSEFCHFAVTELASGNRVYIPEIGYLSLSAGYIKREEDGKKKITGKEIYIRNINFQPESKFLEKVQMNVSFKKAQFSTLSSRLSEDELWSKMESYLAAEDFLTRRIMQEQFGLSSYMAGKWLAHFVEAGKLKKDSFGRQQIYRRTQ